MSVVQVWRSCWLPGGWAVLLLRSLGEIAEAIDKAAAEWRELVPELPPVGADCEAAPEHAAMGMTERAAN